MALAEKWSSHFPEHPDKIAAIKEILNGIDWAADDRRASISKLFNAIDDLANAELRYYYRRRRSRAVISTITRVAGWFLGALGILMPLLASTDASRKDLTPWGFVFIAAAASAFGANSLFGGTSGHVNFVQAQLATERLMIQNRLIWQHFLSAIKKSEISDDNVEAAFAIIKKYAFDYADIAAKESLEWQRNVTDELTKIMASLKTK